MKDYTSLPDDLPAPVDDGAGDHLSGMSVPDLVFAATDGSEVTLAASGPRRTVVYLFPLTGRPGIELPEGWDLIPGARGCTPEACGFRDHFRELRDAGADRVYGMSSQDTDYQAEAVERLHLPFAFLSDPGFALADALRLPTFAAPGRDRLYSRLTLVIRAGLIEKAFYPVFPPGEHAEEVLGWLRSAEGV